MAGSARNETVGVSLRRSRDTPMKMTIEVDCTPVEARMFLGLPDVNPLNEHLVEEMKRRMDANISLLEPETLLKTWTAFGGQATDAFQRLMTAAASGAMGGVPKGK